MSCFRLSLQREGFTLSCSLSKKLKICSTILTSYVGLTRLETCQNLKGIWGCWKIRVIFILKDLSWLRSYWCRRKKWRWSSKFMLMLSMNNLSSGWRWRRRNWSERKRRESRNWNKKLSRNKKNKYWSNKKKKKLELKIFRNSWRKSIKRETSN